MLESFALLTPPAIFLSFTPFKSFSLLAPLVSDWNEKGMGFKLSSGRMVNHILWADNLWLFSNSLADLKLMNFAFGDVSVALNSLLACR